MTERRGLGRGGDECREESDLAGIWKRHHILGVALTQADIIQWKP